MSHLSSLLPQIALLQGYWCPILATLSRQEWDIAFRRVLGLELKPQRGLQVTSVADNRRYLTYLRVSDCLIRISKLRMVEDVKRFETELEHHLLTNGEVFEQRPVKVCPPRTNQGVTTGIAVRVRRRSAKRRGEKPVIERLRVNDLCTWNEVGT